MTYPVRILENVVPPRTPFNTRLPAMLVDRLLALDAGRIRNLWNPRLCHIDDLPFLAWALSVDIWNESWPDAKKRSVVAHAFEHHKLKGTLAGILAYLDIIDAEMKKVITPKTQMFSGPSLTRDQREAWLSKLPQIRLFKTYSRGPAGKRLFCGGTLTTRFREGRFPQPSGALKRLRPLCTYVIGGVTQSARVAELDVNIFRIFINTRDVGSIFSNQRPKSKRFYHPSQARGRILTVTPVSLAPWRTPIGPTLTPVTSEPELIAQRHARGPGVYTGMQPIKRFLVPSRARFFYYQRFSIFDGTGPVKRPSIQFTGVGRYGYPAHKAELTLRLRAPLDARQARFGPPTAMQRFYIPHNPVPMRKAQDAIVSAKRLSDQIVVRTDTQRGIIAGLPFLAGETYLA